MIFNKQFLIILIGVFICVNINAQAQAQDNLGKDIKIKIIPEKKRFLLGAPIKVSLIVTNISYRGISCDFCEEPSGINCQAAFCGDSGICHSIYRSKFEGGEVVKFNLHGSETYVSHKRFDFLQRSVSVVGSPIPEINPFGSYETIIFLDQFIPFEKAGKFEIDYTISGVVFFYDKKGKSVDRITINSKGSFQIILEETSTKMLENELEEISKELNSKDAQKQFKAIEALCFLDTPLSVKQIAKVLDLEGGELVALEALGRFVFDTPEAQKLIESALFKFQEKNVVIVQVALDQLRKNAILLNEDKIQALLSSKKSGTKCVVIDYLSEIGHPSHISLLEPLLYDGDPQIIEAARNAIDKLKKRIPKDSLNY